MYSKDIKVGGKVVPVIKTIDGPLSNSGEWSKAQEAKAKFLYVVKIITSPGKKLIFVCALDKGAKTGDKFNSIDLRAFPWSGWDCRKPGAVHTKLGGKKKSKKVVAKKPAKKVAPKKIAQPAVGEFSAI